MLRTRTSLVLLISLALSLAAYGGIASLHLRTGTLTFANTPTTVAWVMLAFTAYVIALVAVERSGLIAPIWLWGGALLFRLILLLTEPTLSTDVYRYLWDGYVANNGVSPYAFPIDSPQLDFLSHPIRELANHSWMASPYLPAAQALFGFVTRWMSLTPLSMQIAMVLLDLCNAILLAALLSLSALPQRRLLLYLWNPLVVIEVAHGAHVDTWMILLTLLALWLFLRTERRGGQPRWRLLADWAAPVALALATLTKILPAFLMALFFWRWRWGRIALFLIVTLALLAPAGLRAGWGLTGPLDGHGLFAALRIYGDQWNYNSGLFHWIERFFSDRMGLEAAVATLQAKRIVAVAMLLWLARIWWLARGNPGPRVYMRLAASLMVAYALLAVTFHPWYLLLPLAFLPFLAPGDDEPGRRWWYAAPMIYLSAALFFSYFTYLDPQNLREYELVRRLEWVPTWALLTVAALLNMPSRRRG